MIGSSNGPPLLRFAFILCLAIVFLTTTNNINHPSTTTFVNAIYPNPTSQFETPTVAQLPQDYTVPFGLGFDTNLGFTTDSQSGTSIDFNCDTLSDVVLVGPDVAFLVYGFRGPPSQDFLDFFQQDSKTATTEIHPSVGFRITPSTGLKLRYATVSAKDAIGCHDLILSVCFSFLVDPFQTPN